MKLTKNLGMLLLGIWLIVTGLLNPKAVKKRDVKDTNNAEVDTKIVTDKPEKVSINQLQTALRHRIMKEKTIAGTKYSSPTIWSKLSTLLTSLISSPS